MAGLDRAFSVETMCIPDDEKTCSQACHWYGSPLQGQFWCGVFDSIITDDQRCEACKLAEQKWHMSQGEWAQK